MNFGSEKAYWHIRNGGAGYYEEKRGLIAVWGKEAEPFLDGMITNDVKRLEDGQQMLAAFPNAQGRLLALVRVLRQGDKFLIETEKATREKVYQNLFRFTFAGEFFVEDLSDRYRAFAVFGDLVGESDPDNSKANDGLLRFDRPRSASYIMSADRAEKFWNQAKYRNTRSITEELYAILRIEDGVPEYGVDMDETTVVPELGLDGLISYHKGCYIGQEIIARIHFRGHVAKQLTGLVLSDAVAPGTELATTDGKPAGRITSTTYSPKLEKAIALGFVRYDNLAKDTKLFAGEAKAMVVGLPFGV